MKGMLELEEKHIGMIHIICHANVPSKGIFNQISGQGKKEPFLPYLIYQEGVITKNKVGQAYLLDQGGGFSIPNPKYENAEESA